MASGKFHPGRFFLKGHSICIALSLQKRCGVISTDTTHLRRLLYSQPGFWSDVSGSGESHSYHAGTGIHFYFFKYACIEGQP